MVHVTFGLQHEYGLEMVEVMNTSQAKSQYKFNLFAYCIVHSMYFCGSLMCTLAFERFRILVRKLKRFRIVVRKLKAERF